MHLQSLSLSTTTVSAPPLSSSFQIPDSFYQNSIPKPKNHEQIFFAQPTISPTLKKNPQYQPLVDIQLKPDQTVLAQPTPFVLRKRQVVVEIEVITIVTVVPKQASNPTPVVVTVNVPPPTQTQISQGGWPIIDPGSAAACWSDYACNSVCPNFQQNGWYAHCMDSACSQCRCQIISSSMCTGPSWTNATWSSGGAARGYAGSSNSKFVNRNQQKDKLIGLTALVLILVILLGD